MIWGEVLRLHRPVGVGLVFFPCLWGSLVGHGGHLVWTEIGILALGAVWMRSLGCLINDYWDRTLDAQVVRTRHRPLARGALTPTQALRGIGIFLLPGLGFAYILPWLGVVLGCIGLGLAALYPLCKCWTSLPQLYLGFLFNWGIWVAYALALPGGFSLWTTPFWMVVGLHLVTLSWTLEYDTVYAYQDYEDDARLHAGSLAVKLGRGRTSQRFLLLNAVGRISLMGILVNDLYGLSWARPSLWPLVGWYGYRLWHLYRLDVSRPDACYRCFRNSLWEGVWISVALFFGFFWAVW